MPQKLPRTFYARHPLKVAGDLLGNVLCSRRRNVLTKGVIVEVEAYLGADDPASHAYRGETKRNAAMFGPAGFAYVYFTYGNHFCMNVVTGEEGVASAVLIRALEPLMGISAMKRRRRMTRLTNLCSGPGKLTQAMAIGRSENGADLEGNRIWIERAPKKINIVPTTSGRIGLRVARELPYRFFCRESVHVSKYRK